MKISIQNQASLVTIKKPDPVYISKKLIQDAKEVSVQNPQSKTVIYGENIIPIDSHIFKSLQSDFKNDFSQYQGIAIAEGNAKAYLEKIVDFVMEDLNIKNADKNKDGDISMSESLYTKNTLKDGFIVKPIEFLDQDTIAEIKKDDRLFASINEIVDENIELDKDRDGKVTAKEITDSSEGGEDKVMKELYAKLALLSQKISALTSKLANADEKTSMLLNSQLQGYMKEQSSITSQIKKVIEIRRGQVVGES